MSHLVAVTRVLFLFAVLGVVGFSYPDPATYQHGFSMDNAHPIESMRP